MDPYQRRDFADVSPYSKSKHHSTQTLCANVTALQVMDPNQRREYADVSPYLKSKHHSTQTLCANVDHCALQM
jgi:hypothetical protein